MRACCIEEQVLSINFGSAPRIAVGIAQEPGQESMYSTSYYSLSDMPFFQSFLNLLVHSFTVFRDAFKSCLFEA